MLQIFPPKIPCCTPQNSIEIMKKHENGLFSFIFMHKIAIFHCFPCFPWACYTPKFLSGHSTTSQGCPRGVYRRIHLQKWKNVKILPKLGQFLNKNQRFLKQFMLIFGLNSFDNIQYMCQYDFRGHLHQNFIKIGSKTTKKLENLLKCLYFS